MTGWTALVARATHCCCWPQGGESFARVVLTGMHVKNCTIEAPLLKLIAPPPSRDLSSHLVLHCSAVTELILVRQIHLDTSGLTELLSELQSLRQLQLMRCDNIVAITVPLKLEGLLLSNMRTLASCTPEDGVSPTSLRSLELADLPSLVTTAMELVDSSTTVLEKLVLRGTGVWGDNDTAASITFSGFPKLRELHLERASQLLELNVACPALKRLTVAGCTRLQAVRFELGQTFQPMGPAPPLPTGLFTHIRYLLLIPYEARSQSSIT